MIFTFIYDACFYLKKKYGDKKIFRPLLCGTRRRFRRRFFFLSHLLASDRDFHGRKTRRVARARALSRASADPPPSCPWRVSDSERRPPSRFLAPSGVFAALVVASPPNANLKMIQFNELSIVFSSLIIQYHRYFKINSWLDSDRIFAMIIN